MGKDEQESQEQIDAIVDDFTSNMSDEEEETKPGGEEEKQEEKQEDKKEEKQEEKSDSDDIDFESILGEEEEAEEEEEVPEGLDEKSREAFIAQRLKIKELQGKLDAGEGGDESEWKARYEASQKRLAQADLASTDAFQQQYDQPIATKIKAMTDLIGDEDVTALKTALGQTLRDRLGTLQQHYPDLANVLLPLTVDLDSMRNARSSALQAASETAASLSYESTEAVKKATGTAIDGLKETSFVFMNSAESKEWNKPYLEKVDASRAAIESGSMSDGEIRARAIAYEATNDLVAALVKRNAEYAKQIQTLTGKKPRIAAKGAPAPKKKTTGKKGESVEDIVDEFIATV